MSEVTVMLDAVAYDHKPSVHVPEITNRLKRTEPVTVPVAEFAQAVADGQTWCGGCYALDPSKKFGSSKFLGRQLFALDFDNDTEVRDESGEKVKDAEGHYIKRPLMPDEDGYLDPWEAHARWARLFHADPLAMYPSMSFQCGRKVSDRWSQETRMKYRMVLDAGRLVTDEAEADEIINGLMENFPECDRSCSNHNRLLFGAARRVQFVDGGVTHHAYAKR